MASRMNKISRGSGRGLLLFALLFAAVAAVLAFVALSRGGNSKDEAAAADTKTVVVASRDIAARTDLKSDMLKTIDVPVDSALSGSYSDASALVGQTTIVENFEVRHPPGTFSELLKWIANDAKMPTKHFSKSCHLLCVFFSAR